MPPTLWQSTQRVAAPSSWQAAQREMSRRAAAPWASPWLQPLGGTLRWREASGVLPWRRWQAWQYSLPWQRRQEAGLALASTEWREK